MDMRKKSIIERFFANKTRRKRIAQLAAALSVLVVAGVFWRLTQPVITMTANPVCGKTEHTHSSACYQDVLTCGQEESEEHSHSSSCYSSVLCCGKSEHAHTSACYPETVEEPTVVASVDETTGGTLNEGSGGASNQEPAAVETTDAPAGETTDAPAGETTDAPAGETTDASAGETTDAPAGETTDAPASETTDAPAGETTDAPAGEPTEAPTGEPTEEPTAVPAPVLERLSASAERVYVGQSVTWSFAAAHADALTYRIADGTGAAVASGTLAADVQSVSWTASAVGSYTMTVTATNESGSDSASASVTVEEAEELTASVWMDARSCFAGDSVTVHMATSGGAELTNVELTVAQDGNVLTSQQSISDSISVTTSKATGVGTLRAKLTVTDALGTTVTDSCEIPVAVKTTGDKDKWMQAARIELGESWPENLLAVAETQLGYKESSENFIIREDGSRQGYSIYGDWYGCPYEEWCAMFVSFCLDRADVPESAFSRDASCAQWISELRYMGLYANRSACEPAPGDLIFFDWDGDQHSDHVGIVSGVSASTVETIEGNSGRSVRRRSYARDDSQIMGYGLLNLAYENHLAANADSTAEDPTTDDEPVPEDELLNQTQNEQTSVGYEAFLAEIEALEEGDEAALTELEDRIVEAYDAGELSDEEFAALAAALYGDIATYSEDTQEMITVSLVINNSAYTYDTGSGCSHVQIESTDVEGLNKTDFTYTALGTGKAYWVGGTGTLISYSIPAGTSMSDNGLSFLKLTIANLVNNGVDSNANRYVSPYSWVDESNKVCSVNTVFNADTTLYLCLYSDETIYYFDYCCDETENHSISGALSSLYPHASVQVGQSVSAEYVPLPAHVNANYNVEGCSHGLTNNQVLTSWYILDQNNNRVAFTEGLTILDTYLPTQGNAIKVYANWETITADSMVTVSFEMPDGSTASPAVAINTGTALGEQMPANPTLDSCEFIGWSYDGGLTYVTDTTPVTSDITLTAVFNVPVTVYTRDYAGGNTSSEIIKGSYTVQTGHSLAEAVNSAGAHITAEPFIGSYMFLGWHPETYSYGVNTKDLSECIVTGALNVSEVYEKVCTLTFQYTIDDEIHIARTYYVKVNGTIYDAMDADGVKPDLYGTMLAPVQVTGYQFNDWFLNGSEYYPSYYTMFNTDTVFTADLTKLKVVSFEALVPAEGDTYETVTIDTRYVAANQALRTAVDENGDAVATLPTAQSTADAAFRQWVDAAGNTVTLDTVITDDVTFTADYSNDFVTVKYVYASDGVEVSVHADSSLLSGTEIAEADMPAQEDLTADSYPPNYYLSGWKVMDASGELADVTWPYTATADVTTFYAQFEAPLTITFQYEDGQENYVIHVRAGTTFGEALAANPDIPAPADIIETDEDGIGRFMGWTYAVFEDGATDYTYALAEDNLTLTSNMTFVAGYDFTTYKIIVHDVDPDGKDYVDEANEGAEFEIEYIAFPGYTLRDVFAESDCTMHDGSDGADRIWYTVDESGNKTRVDLDAEVKADMTVYTYTYRITLVRASTDESTEEAASASVLDYLFPSAEAAVVVTPNDDGSITIELAEGDTLKLSDFVIDGVDYSVYSWIYEGTTYTTSALIAAVNDENGDLHNQNVTLTQVESTIMTESTVETEFYVNINDSWKKVYSTDTLWSPSGASKFVISAAVLEKAYYLYGFRAEDYVKGSKVIGHTQDSRTTIWFAEAVEYDGQVYVPTLNTSTTGSICKVYYVPNTPALTSDNSAERANFEKNNAFYTVTVVDNRNLVYEEGEELPAVQYVLTGTGASVTVKAPVDAESSVEWIISGSSSYTGIPNDDGTITYTFPSVTAPITIRAGIPGEVQIDYVVKGKFEQIGTSCSAAGQTWHEAAPDVAGLTASSGSNDTSKTFSEALVVSDEGYEVKAPTRYTWSSRDDYYDSGAQAYKGYRLFTYRFKEWKLLKSDGTAITDDDGNAIVLQPGDIITKTDMEKYASDGMLMLESVWSTNDVAASSTATNVPDTVAFYVRIDSSIADTEGSNNATPVGEYSDAVYTTYVVGGDAKISGPNKQENVIVGSSTTNAVEIDAKIRSLYPDGVDGVSIGGFPTDGEVLAMLRTWNDRAGFDVSQKITLNGIKIEPKDLTTENFMIRWYVFKYEPTDAWHIDGLLVPRVGKLTVQKTFYGYSAAVEDVKEDYSITVAPTDSTSTAPTLTLSLEETPSDTTKTGYADYDSETDTYTWVLDTYQNTEYKVTENNYTAGAAYNGVSIASLAEYVVRNSGGSGDGKWQTYADGVTVSVKTYPSDISNPESYQTVSFLNSYIPTNTMVVRKVDASSGRGIGNVSFKLYKQNADGDFVEHDVFRDSNGVYYIYQDAGSTYTKVDTLTGNDQGIFTLVGLKDPSYAGTYQLEEVAAPDGYNTIIGQIQFNADASGNITLTPHKNATLSADGITLRITNESESTRLVVRKDWAEGETKLPVTLQLYKNGASMGTAYTAELDGTVTDDEMETSPWTIEIDDIPLFENGERAVYSVKETWIGDTAYDSKADTDGYANYVVTYDPLVYTFGDQSTSDEPTRTVTDEEGNETTEFAEVATLVVHNSTSSGDISFTKVDENGNPLPGAEFALYTLYAANNTAMDEASSDASGQVTFSDVPYGVYYLMQETNAPTGYLLDSTRYKVVLSADGVQVYAPQLDADGNVLKDDEGNIIYGEGQTLTQLSNQPIPVDIVVKKVDNSNNAILLSGATFQLMKKNESGTYENAGDPQTTGESGTISFTGLLPGEYKLVETAAPAGYYLKTEAIEFTIVPGAVGEVKNATFDNTNGNVFTVTNQTGSELPQTGGSGTIPYTIGGLLIMAVALLCGYGSRRRHGRGVGSD